MINAYDVLRDLERMIRIEQFPPPDWKGIDPAANVALIVRVLVAHINRAIEAERDHVHIGDE